MHLRDHKTKIVCTIGPASSSPGVMEAMIRAGMDVARLNFSHGTPAEHAVLIERLRGAAAAVGRPLAILGDLPGPKIRLGDVEGGPVRLTKGQTVYLTPPGPASRGHACLPVGVDGFAARVSPGDTVFLKDGLVQLRVQEVTGEEVRASVSVGGDVGSRAGVNVPGVDLGVRAFTEQDRVWLAFAVERGVDAVAQSFVAGPEDVRDLREAVSELGARPFVVAKVERARALDHIDGILEAADAIMVARGDLGVETSLDGIALVQKRLIARAVDRGRPVITATQMLESMVGNPRPTRAEATDVANAILDGTDCVMLSAESAVGAYPVEAVGMLARIAAVTEPQRGRVASGRPSVLLGAGPEVGGPAWGAGAEVDRPAGEEAAERGGEAPTLVDLIALGVRDTTRRRSPVLVLVPTRSGATARNVARFRLGQWVVAVSPLEATCRALQFSYGVCAIHESRPPGDWNAFARSWLRSQGLAPGLVILTSGPSAEHPEGNHRMELMDL